jgi:signal transduction histidine kinase
MSNLIRNLKNEKNELNCFSSLRRDEWFKDFLSNISHELRTPLNAIVNLTDSISSEVENEDIKKNAKLSNTRHIVY